MTNHRTLAVIPARGGSKGLPGKNIKPLNNIPLIGYSILFSKKCDFITKTIVSTDSDQIAEVALKYYAEVPFLRPKELAEDTTPILPVLHHAVNELSKNNEYFDYIMLIDPTSPGRSVKELEEAFNMLVSNNEADGIISVSEPEFNPIWHCVTMENEFMVDLFPNATTFHRRQDLPKVYRINACFYIWKMDYIMSQTDSWRIGKHLIYETNEDMSIHIDTLKDFEKAELFLKTGFIKLDWLE